MSGKVRFFCACGREIGQGLSEDDKKYLTIKIAEATCQCSDCMLAYIPKEDK